MAPATKIIVDLRQDYRDQQEAFRRTEQEIQGVLAEIQGHLGCRNYGLAEVALARLQGDLIHDHGAQDFRPMLDRHAYAIQKARDANPPA